MREGENFKMDSADKLVKFSKVIVYHSPCAAVFSAYVLFSRSNHSVGRFCSSNIGQYKPFPMYSVDGYARIHFHSDSVDIGAGFLLSYWLLNTSRLSKNCV